MGWLLDVYQVCAVVGGTLLVVQTLMMVFGAGGDHDVGHDLGHSPGDLSGHDVGHVQQGLSDIKWLSLKTVVSCLTFFGLAGLAGTNAGLEPALTLGIAIVAGGLAIFLVAFLMASLSRLQSKGNLVLGNAVGTTARVYLRIPAARKGAGKVTVEVQGRSVEVDATTAGAELATGATVTVLGLVSADMLDVAAVPAQGGVR